MKLSHRAYPHPVVGNGDDVVDAAFQASIEVSDDKLNFFIAVRLQCSSTTITRLVKRGEAVYVLHVECGNTLYRSAFEFTEHEKEFIIPGENLNATVEVNVVAQARRDLKKYRVQNAHPDYGDTAFGINAGDILAVAEGFTFDADITFDSLRSMSSIMQIRQRDEGSDLPMDVDLNDEKITIWLSRTDFDNYRVIRADKAMSAILVTTLVLPALVEALTLLKDKGADVEDTRWCRCLKRRVDFLRLSLDSSSLSLAQSLLELPIKRAFMSARAYLES